MRCTVAAAAAVAALLGCKAQKAAATADQDALWKLAPEGAQFGLVLSSRALEKTRAMAEAVVRFAATVPEVARFKERLEQQARTTLGKERPTLGPTDKGMAFFAADNGDGMVLALPASMRDTLRPVLHGTKGADTDTFGSMQCKPLHGMYVCAAPVAMFDRIGKGHLEPAFAIAGARGDIESAGQFPVQGTPITFGAAVQIGSGGFVVRGAITGLPAAALQFFGPGGTPHVDATTAGFAVFDPRPFLAMVPVAPVVAGVTTRDLARSIGGPITCTVAGNGTVDVRVPLTAPASVQTVLDHCGDLSPVTASANGMCHLTIPQLALVIDAWIEGNELRIGKKAAPAGKGGVALAGAGNELGTTPWAFSYYGRGSLVGMPAIPGLADLPVTDELLGAIRVMALVNELGLGVRKDGDAIRFLMTVRTALANPDDVIKQLIKIPPRDILAGKTGGIARDIAKVAPQSPFAADLAAGHGGMLAPTAIAGVIATAAIPALVQEFRAKSKQDEAAANLERIATFAKIAAVTMRTFPKGSVLTPGHGCCGEAGNTCQPNAADWQNPVWQALEFDLTEPVRFQYGYSSTDGKTFRAVAIGDLDCDGTPATWTLDGTIGADGKVDTTLTPPPKGVN